MSRVGRLGMAVVLAVGLMTVGGVAAAGPNDPTVLFGAYAQPVGVSQQAALEAWEATAGRQAAIVREYLTWDEEFPTAYHNWLATTGRIPMISLNTRGNNSYDWADVAGAGPGDQLYNEIVDWAGRFRDYGIPFLFTFHHEPETSGDTSFGTNQDFIAAWRNVIDIFRAEGVDNAEYLFITTAWAYGVAPTDRRYAPDWYPGDAWVDHIGADAYNWHDCANPNNTNWRPMAEVIEGFRQFGVLHPDKSLMLPEYGTVEDSDFPNRKAEWFQDAHQLFKQPGYEQFTAILYFNALRAVGCEWAIDSTPQTLAAFQAWGADVYYSATAFPGTPPTPSIHVALSADPDTVTEPGGTVSFDVAVTNGSSAHAVDLSSLDDSEIGSLDGVGSCSLPQTIAPSGAYSCAYSVSVVGTAGTAYASTVTAAGTSDGQPVSDDASASVSIVADAAGTALLVVNNAAALTTGEAAIESRLGALGFDVDVVSGSASTAADAAGRAVVLISSSVTEAAVDDKFRNVAEPVIIWKPWLYDAMDMSATNGNSTTAGTVTIDDSEHPLAAGYTGTVTVLNPTDRMARGTPGGDGHTVASVSGVPALFVYEAGELLADGSPAAGCRIAYPLHTNTAVDLTADGWALFDNAVTWAADGCETVPPVPTVPDPPTGVSAVAGDGEATVSWVAPVDDGGSPLTGFTVTSDPGAISVSVGAGSSSALVSGLTNGVSYTFTVVASNALGDSAPSAPSNPVVPEPPAQGGDVLVVVANTGEPTYGDQAVADRLILLGYDVVVIGSSTVATADASGKVLIVVSSNASTSALGTKFTDVSQPVIFYKPWAYDSMEMTPGNGGSTMVTSVEIVDAGHPLSGGLTGTVVITTSSQRVATGSPAAGGTVVATANGTPTLFAFSPGDTMADGDPAPGCRIGFPAFHETPAFYTALGWQLFDAAVAWATGDCEA